MEIDLTVGIDDPTPFIPGQGKNPIEVPSIMQDGYEIIFQSQHPFYTLCIVEDDVVVYSVPVPSTTTTVNLPTWLEGEYEIRLYGDTDYYFYGYIEL